VTEAPSSLTPAQIVAELDRYIVGQTRAKRAVAIALRNRWRRQSLPAELRDEVAPKNIIMIGPTGVGKTEVARRLAKLAQAPFLKVEASKYTEVGYVGRDVESMVRDLTEQSVGMVKTELLAQVHEKAEKLAEDRLLDHAHHEPLRFIDPQGGIPVVPVFLNSIHHPGPTPRRCYDLGRALRVAIETYAPGKRILVYSSGGFSHFTAGYPWRHYHGPHTLGSISVEFDQEIVARLRAGDQERLAELSSQDLLDNGQVELRQTIVLAGMLRTGAIPDFLHYVPFYRAGMGIAVGIWTSP